MKPLHQQRGLRCWLLSTVTQDIYKPLIIVTA